MEAILVSVTTKGQVVIPKIIRDTFNIRKEDKVSFEIEGDRIVVRPAATVADGFGMFKNKINGAHTEYEMDEGIKNAITEKYKKKS